MKDKTKIKVFLALVPLSMTGFYFLYQSLTLRPHELFEARYLLFLSSLAVPAMIIRIFPKEKSLTLPSGNVFFYTRTGFGVIWTKENKRKWLLGHALKNSNHRKSKS